MTAKIDAEKVRSERNRRAWTQEHLAEVSGLALRTVQRIEKTGSASTESTRALACCFEMSPSDLVVSSKLEHRSGRAKLQLRPAFMAAALATLALVSFSITRFAVAEDITLSFHTVVTAQDDVYEHIGEMSIGDGEESQFQMDGIFKELVTPSDLGNSQILISLKIYADKGGEFALVSEPSLVTTSGKEAVFSLGLKDPHGSRIRVAVTPQQ
ncbi:MAG: helix-turn-helix transcriptional regulator [Pseudomonadota bacterium]